MAKSDTSPPENKDTPDSGKSDFEQAAEEKPLGLVAEFLLFLKENKAWWMTPILLALLLLGLAVWLSTSAAAPFIYPLF